MRWTRWSPTSTGSPTCRCACSCPAASSLLAALACVVAAALVLPAAGALLALVLAAAGGVPRADRRARRRPARGGALAARAELSRELVTLLDAAPELVAWGAADGARRARRARRAAGRPARPPRRRGSRRRPARRRSWPPGAGALAMLAVAAPGRRRRAHRRRDGRRARAAGARRGRGRRRRRRHRGGQARGRGRRPSGSSGCVGSPPVAGRRRRGRGDGGVALRGLTLERGGPRASSTASTSTSRPGERVALTGASGAGKSTLADVLAGFAEPSGGRGPGRRRRPGGHGRRRAARDRPLDPAGPAHLRDDDRRQRAHRRARRRRRRRSSAALRAVGAGPWLDALPDGLATRLGEFGERCSGGERQRIGLARAYLCGGAAGRCSTSPRATCRTTRRSRRCRAVMDAAPGRGVLLVTHRREEVALAGREVRLGA